MSCIIACWLLTAMYAQAAGDGTEIHSGAWTLQVTALADDILRVRAAASGALPEDASWAVPEEIRHRSVHVSLTQNADSVEFKTAAMAVRIERSPLRIIVSDLKGHVITADKPTVALEPKATCI